MRLCWADLRRVFVFTSLVVIYMSVQTRVCVGPRGHHATIYPGARSGRVYGFCELPAAPDGYERIVVDEKIMLIEIATQVVQDVLADYLLGDSQASGDVRAGAQVLQLA
jgi:hypothetical protein